MILSNVPGLLRDPEDETSLITTISKGQLEQHMDYAKGRMKKKVLGASEAITGGVKRVILGSANLEKPLTQALLGTGTVID